MPSSSVGSPVVFLGPTLPVADAARILPATYLPPASQGSIVVAVKRRTPAAILLIDGVFEQVPAVRHKEILWAMSRGVPVFGAASMGALRAAELHHHGMIGIGLIFRWFRRFPLLPDDAVAVLQSPPELGCLALTRALVDVRMTTRRLERAAGIDRDTRNRLERAAATMNFRDRTFRAIVEKAYPEVGESARRALRAKLVEHVVPQKQVDALCALRHLRRLAATGELGGRPGQFVVTNAFLRDLRDSGINLD